MTFRTSLLVAVFFVLANVTTGYAIPLTDLNNKHNLSNQSSNTVKAQPVGTGGTDQICVFCHTPHAASPDSTLWSRPDPATAVFPLYAQDLVIKGTLGGDAAGQVARSQYTNADPSAYPNGASRMCLSCHDGVTAIGLLNDNTTINMLGGTNLSDIPGANPAAIIDLSTSHPISFVYDGAVLTDLLTYYGAGSYVLPDPSDTVDTPLDGQDRMQCTTCHDPHNDTRTAIGIPFWRQTSGSVYDDVCNACHTDAGFVPGGPAGDHLP